MSFSDVRAGFVFKRLPSLSQLFQNARPADESRKGPLKVTSYLVLDVRVTRNFHVATVARSVPKNTMTWRSPSRSELPSGDILGPDGRIQLDDDAKEVAVKSRYPVSGCRLCGCVRSEHIGLDWGSLQHLWRMQVTSSEVVLAVAVFLASAVEMVEALTIVIAVGVTRGWRSSLEGAASAVGVLAAIVIILGPALVRYVPINLLRSVVGGVLLVFGLQWLRKAVLRASGLKDKRNEDLVYKATVSELSETSKVPDRDMQGFTIAFKGVFIEGLEVIIIVLTLGSSAHDLGLATVAALLAVALVGLVGVIVSRQLSGVPENSMKLAVGLMLISFGTFWGGEGLGLRWPGSDLIIPVLVLAYGLVTFAMVKAIKVSSLAKRSRSARVSVKDASETGQLSLVVEERAAPKQSKILPYRLLQAFARFWWEFFVGETPEVFIGTVLILGVIETLFHLRAPIYSTDLIVPVLVALVLSATVAMAYRSYGSDLVRKSED